MKRFQLVAVGAVLGALAPGAISEAESLITSARIKNGTIEVRDISPGAKRALRGSRGARGLRGSTGAEGPPGPPGPPGPAAASVWATRDLSGQAYGQGLVSLVLNTNPSRTPGSYDVRFDRDVSRCAYVATTLMPGFASSGYQSSGLVYVGTLDASGTPKALPFSLIVAC